MFSVVQDQQSRELSQHHTQRQAKRLKVSEAEVKLPPVIALDACQVLRSNLICKQTLQTMCIRAVGRLWVLVAHEHSL